MSDNLPARQRVVLSLASYSNTESKPFGNQALIGIDTLLDLARDLNIPMRHEPQIAALLISLRTRKNVPPSLYAAAAAVLSCVYDAARAQRNSQ